MYAKKLHTLRLWQKNCTPSGFYGKKIAPFWAASLSEIAIWCATWTGMQNNCSIIKLYYRVLIIELTLFFRVLAHSALYMTGKNGVLNGQFSRSAQRNTNPDGGIKQTWERKLEMRFRGKQNNSYFSALYYLYLT